MKFLLLHQYELSESHLHMKMAADLARFESAHFDVWKKSKSTECDGVFAVYFESKAIFIHPFSDFSVATRIVRLGITSGVRLPLQHEGTDAQESPILGVSGLLRYCAGGPQKEVGPMVGLPRHRHFNVPLQVPFLQSFRETGHLFHAVGSLGRNPATAIKSNERLAQESNSHFSGLLRRAWGYGVYILPTRVLMG